MTKKPTSDKPFRLRSGIELPKDSHVIRAQARICIKDPETGQWIDMETGQPVPEPNSAKVISIKK